MKERVITVVQSSQTPPKPQGPSSGEQHGGYRAKGTKRGLEAQQKEIEIIRVKIRDNDYH